MQNTVTAIVIDDDKDLRAVFCECLETIGVKVVGEGHNGKKAVELYQQKKPDVVFLDLMMPEYDGFYALENIRKINANSKIVIVTAHLAERDVTKMDSLKPTKIFYKPFDIDHVKKLLDELEEQTPIVRPDRYHVALVSFVIYDTLKKISESTLNEVGSRLCAKHNCYFSDCLEHPEYLRDVLKEIFGDGCRPIMDTINKELANVAEQKQISNFLVVLNG
ncbi:MAG: response regulator [Candidatus Nitrosotenuis sp.]|nr:MAG: response regulator [Candidatus Nitrosotenuis sp.]